MHPNFCVQKNSNRFSELDFRWLQPKKEPLLRIVAPGDPDKKDVSGVYASPYVYNITLFKSAISLGNDLVITSFHVHLEYSSSS